MDKLRDIETFVGVVEAGSFAAAAETAGVTPVMVGRRISLIEQRLGGKLLERTTRRLTLTPAGEQYYRHGLDMLGRLRTAERLVRTGRDFATGQLTVTCSSNFGREHVAPHLRDFIRANPDVHISLNLSDYVVDLMRTGYTIGIRTGPVTDPNLVAARLAPNRMVVCGTPAYFARHGVPRMPEDLSHHNCLAYNEHGGQPRGWHFQNGGHPVTIRPSGSLTSNDGAMLTRWALEGAGVAWRPEWEVAGALARGIARTVLDDFTLANQDIFATYPPQNPVPAKIRLFIAWMREVYARPGYWTAAPAGEGGR
ncbi:LysR family transcriptional regulator [Ancylobacter mangrovi]|uniref:LysR family transcriptional regulator n=1 Tax=Ancylobacter mangrovi TaxID=2972472 RepID=UPI002161990A|nr:LysR family transcriptional regulator [Ancylobacter mangrovi]MCS0502927.1 LysR family transcriptional regulator [Ancylobacter mangrovi]